MASRNKILVFLLFCHVNLPDIQAQGLSRMDYIEKYKDLAIKEMKRTGIPASITLAQGLLESDDGNSRLAGKANNHFGIKCHNDWDGGKIYHNDDKRRECFRKYGSVYESYKDHSDFLKNYSRYKFLFDLKPTDYKGWAYGLQKAGYATNRKYAKRLIHIIEEYELYQYDDLSKPKKKRDKSRDSKRVDENEIQIDREIFTVNNTNYIIAKEGDTYTGLALKCHMMVWEIYKYNGLPKDANLVNGQIIYIQPKRNKAEKGFETHEVQEGETMYTISQKYAVKLKKLYKRNNLLPGFRLDKGQIIKLR